ncbi:glycoside hydrolase family 32 protein [Actinomyces sp. W5033]|uniref:glycoside hydrolase family 32 protein n=1 Tax=Actinomyces sp. W5033 TaxID=3446479 RepID=UPI003EDED813
MSTQTQAAAPWPTTPAHRVEIAPAAQRRRAEADPARPRWHVTPPWGWLNDPNGLSVQPGPDGQPVLHLFYQHNSHAPVHELIEWGHQVSADLVHWRDLPVALTPGPAGPDALGCWSGVVVDDMRPDGTRVPTMIYSGSSDRPTQTACLAVAEPGDPWLTRWVKEDEANPVIDTARRSVGTDLPEMRDHSVWREDGRWYQVMGSGLPGQGRDGAQGGAALCFSSEDLRTWTYEGPLAVGDGDVSATGTVWECPELCTLGGPGAERDLLTVSAWHEEVTMRTMWMTGERTGTRMRIDAVGRSDLGENYFYAPQSVLLPDGRRVVIGWMQPNRSRDQRIADGWAGSMSVPRTMTLAADGTPRFAPVAEIESLHGARLLEADGEAARSARLASRSVDLVLSGRLTQGAVTIDLLADASGERRTRVSLIRREAPGGRGQAAWTGWLSVDRSASAEEGSPWRGEESRLLEGPVPLGADGEVELRVLLDRSSLEVFVNGQPLSARVGADPDDDRLVLDAPGLEDAALSAWHMEDAYTLGRLEP